MSKIMTFLRMPLFGVVTLLIVMGNLHAQEDLNIKKRDFKQQDDGFDVAWEAVKAGDDLYATSRVFYAQALEEYLKAFDYNQDVPELNYKIGICYLHAIEKEKALRFLQMAYKANKTLTDDLLYWLARAHHFRYEFDAAIEKYRQFHRSLGALQQNDWNTRIQDGIKACQAGKELMKDTARVFINNVGDNINSTYDDYSPHVTADDSLLFFTSRRENNIGGRLNDYNNQFYEDIYTSFKWSGQWQPAKNLGEPVNTKNNEAAVGITSDGQTLYVYDGSKNNGDILYTELVGDNWGKTESFSRQINSRYHESSISFSYNGQELFFVSDNPDNSVGGRDIFVSRLDEEGKWGDPKNLGPAVNTPKNEEGVFLHPDNRTLYFSSKGHNTMGGYDIFVTRRDASGRWSKPENLGYPVNTPGDDVFITVSANGKHGYYSSSRKGGYGGKDIYDIIFLGPEKELMQSHEDNLIASVSNPVKETMIQPEVDVKTTLLSLVKGVVKDAKSDQPLDAQVVITDNDTKAVLMTKPTNSKTGRFLVSLPFGKNYGLAIDKKGYLFHSENFNVQEYSQQHYQDIFLDVKLKKIEVGAKIILNNVFFESGQTTPIKTSYPELDRLAQVMRENPEVRIRISGHTDNVGSKAFNKRLSLARAQGVVDYLKQQGIKAGRLEAEGMAFDAPIATNETEEGRKKNRRVEAEIIQ